MDEKQPLWDREPWDSRPWEDHVRNRPTFAPVTIPPRHQTGAMPEKANNRRAKFGFFGLGGLIVVLTIVAIALAPQFEQNSAFKGEGPGSNYSGGWNIQDYLPAQTVSQPPTIPSAETGTGVTLSLYPLSGDALTRQEVYTQNLPSIVYIEGYSKMQISSGTGIVMTDDGYIITNAHVIEGCYEAEVVLWDESVYKAELVGWDADEDLAVIKIDAEGLTPAAFGDSSMLQVGDNAFALGNPLGEEYRATFTDGIISALDRYISVDDVYMNLIQTTAAINFGNSGGALINDHGQVVGITTIKIMSDEGTVEAMGFAIPSARVKKVVDSLIDGREILPTAIGITVLRVDEPVHGLSVEEINPLSPASNSGLQLGDIIVRADGVPLRNNSDLARIKSGHVVGEIIVLDVIRDGEELTFELLLVDKASLEETA